MTLKEHFIKFAEKQNRKEEDMAVGRRAFLRNRSYHSYFEGYTEFYAAGRNGKTKLQRVYTGKYYRQKIPAATRILLRCLYSILFVAAVSCFALSSTAQINGNMSPFVTVPQAICIPTLFWVGMTVLSCIFSPALLKIYDYKSTSAALKRSAKWAAGSHAAAALMLLLYSLFTDSFVESLDSIVLMVAAALLLTVIFAVETRIPYETVLNPDAERYQGTVIE